ncbi:MAG: hypothetical protein JO072_07640 [Parafilimonas sp.]|nr:hypothetical protein [Parafilimonas sp.]
MQEQKPGKLNIIVAVYGLKTVTDDIINLIIDGSPQILHFIVNNKVIGKDGWRGQKKTITVVYNYDGGELCVAAAREGDMLTITPEIPKQVKLPATTTSTGNEKLSVLAATYGPDDVTYKVRNMISSYNTLSFAVDNTIFGESWYGVAKTLVIILGSFNEIKAVEIFTERETCYLDLNDVIPVL